MARRPSNKVAQQALRGPRAPAATAPVAAPVAGTIATTGDGRDITEFFLDRLRPLRDAILVARGAGLELYEEVKRDDRVFTALQQRRLGLVSKPWDVEPGNEEPASVAAAAALKADLERIGWNAICEKMHWGVFWGYAVGECIWESRSDEHGSRWTFASIKVRKARRFRMGADNRLRLMTQDNQLEGEIMPDNKFWLYTAGEDADDYPYGLGLAHWLFWPVYFKRHGLRMWAQAVEKFAGPTAIGKFAAGTSKADQDKLLGALQAIHTDSGVIVPDGTEINLLEMSKAAGADQASLYAAMDRAIATIITGQSTTIEAASNRSQTDTHKDVRDELIQADNDLLCESFAAGPLTWWTAWNFPGAALPIVTRKLEPEEDQELSTRVDKALDEMGWQLTEEQVQERYGNGYVRKVVASPPEVPPPSLRDTSPAARGEESAAGAARSQVTSFADPEIDTLDQFADDMADEWEIVVKPVVDDLMAEGQKTGLKGLLSKIEALLKRLSGPVAATTNDPMVAQVESALLQARAAGFIDGPPKPKG
jgi:phage gp29-like protein